VSNKTSNNNENYLTNNDILYIINYGLTYIPFLLLLGDKMKIVPITRHSLPDEIIKQIKKIITDGNLKPGDKLPPERELAERFAVGRTTIREALKALSYTKIIIRTREGAIVNRNVLDYFTDSLNEKLICKYVGLEDLIETRKLIELEITSLAAQRATIEDINILQKNLFNMKKFVAKNDVSEYINTNVEFHETIAEMAQNRVLYEIFISIRGLLKEFQEAIVKQPGIMNRSLEYHEKIFKAIKEKNACRAKEEISAHLEDVGKALISLEKKQ